MFNFLTHPLTVENEIAVENEIVSNSDWYRSCLCMLYESLYMPIGLQLCKQNTLIICLKNVKI